MKKILIIGANGFLGRFLINKFDLKNEKLISPSSKEMNLLNYSDLRNLSQSFDEIYYLAAWTQAGDFCLKNSSNQWVINQKMNTNLIQWWTECQKQAKLIMIGSSCCYGENSNLKEENFLFDIPHESLMSYAMSKKMLVHGAQGASKQFNMKWFCGVPATLYGPNYHTDGRQPHFINDLIKKILKAKYYNEKVILWGSGNQRREIIHVNDFAINLIKVNKKIDNDIVNIGYSNDLSIKEYAQKICDIVDFDHRKIFYDQSKYVGVQKKKLNIEKINYIIKDYEKNLINIDSGLKEVIEWYISNKVF